MANTPESIKAQLNKWLDENQEIKGILEVGDTVLDTIKDINATVGTVIFVLELMGLFGEDEENPFEVLYKALDARMKQIIDLIHDTNFLEHMQAIEEKQNTAVTFAQHAKKYIENGRPNSESMDNEYDWTHEALNQLMAFEGTYWTHTFNKKEAGEIPPPAGTYVWDYRIALPAALRVLTAWFVIVEAIDPDFKTTGSYNEEIRGYASQLLEIHKKITQNIAVRKLVSVKANEQIWLEHAGYLGFPKLVKIGSFLESPYYAHPLRENIYEIPLHVIAINHLNSVMVRCGAVDVWSGKEDTKSTISDWHPLEKRPASQTELQQMLTHVDTVYTYFHYFAKETRKRWLELYDDLGLNALANIVINLRALTQDVAVLNPKSLRGMIMHRGPLSLRALSAKEGSDFTLRQLALKDHLFSYIEGTLEQILEFEALTYK